MLRKIKFASLVATVLGVASQAHAEVDAAITTISTDANTVFGLYKTYAVAAVGFGIAIAIIARLRGRK